MPRLMSVSLTEEAVVERRKTVTRRTGWRFLKPADRLTLCRKVMGRTAGEPLVRLAEVEVVDVRREQLREIHMRPADVEAEGFPGWTPRQFIDFFCEHMGGTPDQEVTRIEWRYLDAGPAGAGMRGPQEMPKAPDGYQALRTGGDRRFSLFGPHDSVQVTHLTGDDPAVTLCGLSLFDRPDKPADIPGWGRGGSGVYGPKVTQLKCSSCWCSAMPERAVQA